jgi:hypothetical protein
VQSAQLSRSKTLTAGVVEDQTYVETACNKCVCVGLRAPGSPVPRQRLRNPCSPPTLRASILVLFRPSFFFFANTQHPPPPTPTPAHTPYCPACLCVSSSVRLTTDGYVCEIKLPSQFLCDFTQDCVSKMEVLRGRLQEVERTLVPVDGSSGVSTGAVKLYGGDSGDVVELDPRKPVTPELVRLVLVAQNAKLVRLAGGPVVAAHESVRACVPTMMFFPVL